MSDRSQPGYDSRMDDIRWTITGQDSLKAEVYDGPTLAQGERVEVAPAAALEHALERAKRAEGRSETADPCTVEDQELFAAGVLVGVAQDTLNRARRLAWRGTRSRTRPQTRLMLDEAIKAADMAQRTIAQEAEDNRR